MVYGDRYRYMLLVFGKRCHTTGTESWALGSLKPLAGATSHQFAGAPACDGRSKRPSQLSLDTRSPLPDLRPAFITLILV
jgi:hypothetical protein